MNWSLEHYNSSSAMDLRRLISLRIIREVLVLSQIVCLNILATKRSKDLRKISGLPLRTCLALVVAEVENPSEQDI